ncbi:MAG: tryptophan--tRNA ligase [Actinomycetota bacterium]|nr:tryptophan--tRNA ligase [Actinomycetota bacterium]
MPRVFSGVQPTSEVPHLGNYIGAFQHWVRLQDSYESLICIVDLHTMTVGWEPDSLARRTRQLAASLIAYGLDPERTILFAQSDVPEHTELAWILTCVSRMGELSRMTQFKDKGRNQDQSGVGAGLLIYPVLMAADVLAYKADLVPIGDDQKQHLELMRDLAERFNKQLGDTFPIPQALISQHGARIRSLDDPSRKMDKSAHVERPNSLIWMNDTPDAVKAKVARAVTDSGREVTYGADKPAVSNLLDIFSAVTGRPVEALVEDFSGKGYADLKSALTEAIVAFLDPFRAKYEDLASDPAQLDKILDRGAERARAIATGTIKQVREKVGLRSSGS